MRKGKFDQLYDIAYYNTNIVKYKLKQNLVLGDVYDGVVYSPEIKALQEKWLVPIKITNDDFVRELYLRDTETGSIIRVGYKMVIKDLRSVEVPVSMLKVGTCVKLKKDVESIPCGHYACVTNDMVDSAEDEILYQIVSREFQRTYNDSMYVCYNLTSLEDSSSFFVYDGQIIPMTEEEYTAEV